MNPLTATTLNDSEVIDSTAEDKTTRANVKRAGLTDTKCQDVLCLVLFGLVLMGWLIIWGAAAAQGDPGRLVHGIDYTGNTCGSDAVTAGVTNGFKKYGLPETNPNSGNSMWESKTWNAFFQKRPRIAYPRTNIDMILNQVKFPSLTNPIPDFFGVCVDECPIAGEVVCSYEAGMAAARLCQAGYGSTKNQKTCQKDIWTKAHTSYVNQTGIFSVGQQLTDAEFVYHHCHKQALNATDISWHCIAARDVQIEVYCYEPLNEHGQPWKITDYQSTSVTKNGANFDVNDTLTAAQCKEKRTKTVVFAGWQTASLVEKMHNAGQTIKTWVGDLQITLDCILVNGFLIVPLFCIIWLWFMRAYPMQVSWGFIIACIVLQFVLMLFFFGKAGLLGTQAQFLEVKKKLAKKTYISEDMMPTSLPAVATEDAENAKLYEMIAWITCIFFCLSLIITISIRSHINVAIAIMKEASRALRDLPFLMSYPIFNFLAIVLLMLHWIFVSLEILSAGSIVEPTENGLKATTKDAFASANAEAQKLGKHKFTLSFQNEFLNSTSQATFDENSVMNYMLIYHTVCMFWVYAAIIGLGYYVIASAVTKWYFKEGRFHAKERNKTVAVKASDMVNLGCCKVNVGNAKESPVADAMRSACKFHLGSLFLGAFITVLCKILTVLAGWVADAVKQLNRVQENCMAKMCLNCLQCLMLWFNKFVKFVSRNAYIYAAMYPDNSFFSACKGVYGLVINNIKEIWVIDQISDFIMFVGKLAIVALTGSISYLWLQNHQGHPSGILVPLCVACLLAYFIASGCMQIYEMTIDTIIICYLEDKTINRPGPYNMEKSMQDLMKLETMNPNKMKVGDRFFFSQKMSTEGKIEFGIGWKELPGARLAGNKAVDIDISAIVFNGEERHEIVDWVGFWRDGGKGLKVKEKSGGQTFNWDGCSMKPITSTLSPTAVQKSKDIRKGQDSDSNAERIDESVIVNLKELENGNVDSIVFCMFIYSKEYTFNMLENVFMVGSEQVGTEAPKQVCRFKYAPRADGNDVNTQEFERKGMAFANLKRSVVGTGANKKTYWEFNCMAHFTGGNTLEHANVTSIREATYPAPTEVGKETTAGLVSKAVDGVAIATMQ